MGRKTNHQKRYENSGRPTLMTPEVIQKLEEAFMMCCTDAEACLFADISPQTLYKYQRDNPEFINRKEALKLNPNLKAKRELVKSIDNNVIQARWWAEHKISEEFGTKTKVELGGKVETIDNNASEQIKKAVEAFEENMREVLTKKDDSKNQN